MANIQKREGKNGVRWRALVRMFGVQESQTFDRKKDAVAWASSLETSIANGAQIIGGEARRRTLDELIDRYIAEVLPGKKSAKDQKQQLLRWKQLLGGTKLSALTPDRILKAQHEIRKQITRTGEPVSNATVNRYHAALSHVLQVADISYGWIEGNPMRRVQKLKEPQGRVRCLEVDEQKDLLDACAKSANPYLLTIVLIALTTGMRKNEIMGLKWKDVDLERQIALIEEPKNGQRRTAHLLPEVVVRLSKLNEKTGKTSAYLFPGRSNLKPMDVKKSWYRAIEHAGLKNFRFHDLRHTAASYLAMDGASVPQIAAVLGHRNHQMAARYAHLSDASTKSIVEKTMSKRIKFYE